MHNRDHNGQDQALMDTVFGSSDSDSDQEEASAEFTWKNVDGIPGLWLCKGFFRRSQQEEMLSAINAEGWFMDASHNQAMRFKHLPDWALELSNLIHATTVSYFHENDPFTLIIRKDSQSTLSKIDWLMRNPLFDQMIVNRYQPGEGICAHVDLMQFDDGIAILSLESTCVMHFGRLPINSKPGYGYHTDLNPDPKEQASKIPVLLEPGDLVVMFGEARYEWTHEINRTEECQVWEGQKICQSQRTSVTLRRLLASEYSEQDDLRV